VGDFMASIFSNLIYVFSALLRFTVLVLVLEWIFFFLPAVKFNGIRRVLFKISSFLLSWTSDFFSIQYGAFRFRGLLFAFLLWMASFYGVPWLVLFSYSLRGG